MNLPAVFSMKAPVFRSARVRCLSLALPLCCFLVTSGCSLLPKAAVDPTRYYLLASTSPGGNAPAAGAPTLILRPIDLANYLKSPAILVRKGSNEIEFHDYARWGEPLDLGIGRVLREELIAGGGFGAVAGGGARGGSAEYSHELIVRVLAGEGASDGAVNFRAVWRLAKTDAPAVAVAGGDFRAADLRWDGKSESTLAAQLSRAVSSLAAEISATVKK